MKPLISKSIRIIFLAILMTWTANMAIAQELDSLATVPVLGDSIATLSPIVPETPSTEDILKAKVDSLKGVLSAISPDRRRFSASRLLAEADSLRLEYEFPRAVEAYQAALSTAVDSAQIQNIKEALTLGQNGVSMMKYCSHPNVIAKRTFPLEDFFLYYPMQDKSWRRSPNMLDNERDAIAQATFIPDSIGTIYYSAKDKDGIRNIYRSTAEDGEWSLPQLINEQLTSWSDEIYPTVSPDGKTMYFASKGLYGMGGYDLYMSQWNRDTKDWGEPINMGLPYSSPYDDFLFINSEDGRYSLFASNRECSRDSVTIYVLEYDALPLRKAVNNVHELKALAALIPGGESTAPEKKAEENEQQGINARAYVNKMSEVRALRDSIYSINKELDAMRSGLAGLSTDEQNAQLNTILEREYQLPDMQKKLDAAVYALQEIELEFLAKGVLLNQAQAEEEAEPELASAYEFVKHEFGEDLAMAVKSPDPLFDYSFRILPQGQFAESNELPDGIIYQIQIASGANKMEVRELRGLSPVFEKMGSTLRYTYSVGIFRSYNDALTHLNSVKKAGFRDAFITAYQDGKQMNVNDARAIEQ